MQGIKLSTETEFAETKEHWLKTYHTVSIVISVIVFFLAFIKGTTLGASILLAFIAFGSAFLVKQEVARIKRLGIAEATFALGNELTTEEIREKVAIFLLDKKIETTFTNGNLIFKGKNAGYTFVRDQNRECFALIWDYSLVKMFSPGRWQMISDYREVLEETGTIAYHIQQL